MLDVGVVVIERDPTPSARVIQPADAGGVVKSTTWNVMARMPPPSVTILILLFPPSPTMVPIAIRSCAPFLGHGGRIE